MELTKLLGDPLGQGMIIKDTLEYYPINKRKATYIPQTKIYLSFKGVYAFDPFQPEMI